RSCKYGPGNYGRQWAFAIPRRGGVNIIELMSRRSSERSAFDLGFEAGASASINLTMKDLRHVERARPLRPSGNQLREELRQTLRTVLRAVQIRSLSRGCKVAHRADRRPYKTMSDVARVLKSRIAVRLIGSRLADRQTHGYSQEIAKQSRADHLLEMWSAA